MIRTGPRGAGQWRRASWKRPWTTWPTGCRKSSGSTAPKALCSGSAPTLNPYQQNLHAGPGLPHDFTHDALCKGWVSAFRSLTGFTDPQVGIDYANAKHIVLYGRNIFESLEIKAINNIFTAVDKGANSPTSTPGSPSPPPRPTATG